MNVFLLEQSITDVPSQSNWLSADELACLSRMRFEKRRADWRLGRWTAKHAVARYLRLPTHPRSLAALEILPEPSGAPAAFYNGPPAGAAISLSHREGTSICAVADADAALGCDIEKIELRSDAFISDYFTPEEQKLISNTAHSDQPQLLALLWSAKESVLKALHIGLKVDTRELEVSIIFEPSRQDIWRPLSVRYNHQTFEGWWQDADTFVRTVVALPAPSQPIPLAISDANNARVAV